MPERVHTIFSDAEDGSIAEVPVKKKPATVADRCGSKSDEVRSSSSKKRKRAYKASDDKDEQSIERPRPSKAAKPAQTTSLAVESKSITRDCIDSSQPKPKPIQQAAQLHARRLALLDSRKKLPIWAEQDRIRKCLRENDVLILSGETGSGKSTQLPQFLMQEQWCTGRIAVTQPRRVAAISLARRVAEEVGSPLGSASPASKVGYSVRFDNSTSPSVRVKYLTEGMLLQEMLKDPALAEYSVVVVDEVHERSVNVDLILGFLKTLITSKTKERKGKPLKVVIMSATADTARFVNYFDMATVNQISAVQSQAQKLNGIETSDAVQSITRVASCAVQGRQYPVEVVHLSEPTNDVLDQALKAIFRIHYKEPLPGDILVFLTGQEAIENLESQITELAQSMDTNVPKLLVHPLFAALPQAVQQQIFVPAPPRTRKVILSTNIAETSVTVPGVRHVIDCGKAKMKSFYSKLGLEALLTKPISQSAAIQRKGRAGREAPGQCYRLYTEAEFKALEKEARPEILRCDLSQSILIMLARGVKNVTTFPFPDRPPDMALKKSLLHLNELGALGDDFTINETGLKMARLPLAPTMSRVIVEAAKPDMDCLADVIDILACLSVENVFLDPTTEEKREAANGVRGDLFRREGDHFRLLVTVRAYAAERSDRKAWAEARWISHRAMQNVLNVRKQLQAQCKSLGFSPAASAGSDSFSEGGESLTDARIEAISRCFIKGFFSNVAYLAPDGSFRTVDRQVVAIHPSSVLFGRKVEAVVFSEFLYTAKAYARNVSAVRLSWIEQNSEV